MVLMRRRFVSIAFLALITAAPPLHAQGGATACADAADVSISASPIVPWKGAPLRVVVTSEKPIEGELTLIGPNGSIVARSRERRGGPPYFWLAEVASPVPGNWRVKLERDKASAECQPAAREIAVRPNAPPRPSPTSGSVWPVREAWTRSSEALFSAWVEKLFDAPPEATLSWPALHEVLRDRQRNFLHNHLGLGEDQMGMVIRPDCADLPYFLRAYFAFKIGLPFGYSKCTRGNGSSPPRCYEWWSIQNEDPRTLAQDSRKGVAKSGGGGGLGLFPPSGGGSQKAKGVVETAYPKIPPRPPGLAPTFGHYIKWSLADNVHSGTGRTPAAEDNTDYYPVPLSEQDLRPGTVYADPYGHLLVLVKRLPQTEGGAGVFLAVDAQPDGTVARKRFWRGNFLFAQDRALGSAGFKRFRPIVRASNGGLRRLANAEITRHAEYGDFSLDQAKFGVEEFYDRMDDLMSPSPLDPLRAMKEAITSLEEQVRARVTSVENGRKWQASAKGEATMPDGAAIFETTGAWEDFATPSRDLRLLIAIDVVRNFPDRVSRRPERYAMPAGKAVAEVKAELEGVLAAELSARKFTYPRSDGSAWALTVKDVVDRRAALEMAYNLNDCVEARWGASEGSEEAAPCRRRAPPAQVAKMGQYRAWFQERRRPPRG